MTARKAHLASRCIAGVTSLLLATGTLGLMAPAASADAAPVDPADPATPATVTADALPTVQINGVAWSQVVIGNTVYVAGKFSTARPAGAAAGTQETVRNNMLAYDIRTGELITSFAPDLNAQALAVTASPDGTRVYVAGDFTVANGQTRRKIAAYDTATGQLVADFKPSVTGQIRALAATDTTVYLGGSVTAVGSTSRTSMAAVSAVDGALLPWAPVPGVGSTAGNDLPDNDPRNSATSTEVMAMVVTDGGSQVVVGGRFDSLNGTRSTGVGALDAVSGATRSFAIGQMLTNQGVNSAVYSLTTDGSVVYGTAYDYYGPGNLEGTFAVDSAGGSVRWIGDCRGDSYSSFAVGGALYVASHAHDCANIGGYPEQNPQVNKFATAESLAATGTTGAFTLTNADLAGQPAPSLLTWFPTFSGGTYTGQDQAGWSVTGNSQYLAYGGEFPAVNGTAQQGLVRFAFPGTAPSTTGPNGGGLTPTVVATGPGTARVSWTESSDQDNATLTYRVYRDDGTTPVYEVTTTSTWYDRNPLAYTDTGVSAGTHSYKVVVVDPVGNSNAGDPTSVVVTAGTTAARSYAGLVTADGATNHWSLGQSAGSTTAYDSVGGNDLTVNGGISLGQSGAIAKDTDTAAGTDGTKAGFLATEQSVLAPQTFSLEGWFSTTTRDGGKIVGFGSSATGTSANYDRAIYLDSAGRLNFGLWPGSTRVVTSPRSYNDGAWHQVTATVDASGMTLYVDGVVVASRTDTTGGQPGYGYWRIGGDSTWSGAEFFTGRVDEFAVYPKALSAAQVSSHYTAGSTGAVMNLAPTASFTSSTTDLAVALDGSGSTDPDGTVAGWSWAFGDGTTGTGRTASHAYPAAGTYAVTLTVTDDDGATATRTAQVTVTAPPADGIRAADAFGREVTGGLGTADRGGAWSVTGSAANASVTGGSGRLTAGAAVSIAGQLGVSVQDVAAQVDLVLEKAPTGGGTFVSLGSRSVGSTRYSTQAWFAADGSVEISLVAVVEGAETEIGSYTLPGKYVPGTALTVRTEAVGSGTTTLQAKAWTTGSAEPAWQVSATDSRAGLQRAGGLVVDLYQSRSATSTQTIRLDDVWVGAAGSVPPAA